MPIVRALVSSIIDAFLRFLTFLTFFSLSLSLFENDAQCTNSRRRCLNTASGGSSPKRTGNNEEARKARRVESRRFPPTFWTLTKILPKANGRTGFGAYGILTWKGRRRATEEKIGGTHKTVWKIVDDDDDEFGGIEEDALKLALPDDDEEETEERGK